MSPETAAYVPPQLRSRSSTSSSEESASSQDSHSTRYVSPWRLPRRDSSSSQESIPLSKSPPLNRGLKVVRKSFGFIGALSWRTGAPLPSLPPANKDLTYDEIHIGDVVWFSEDKLRKNSGLIAKFQAVEGNDRPGDHPAIILDKRIDEVSGEESIRFQLCTSQKKRRYTHYQIEDESGVSYGRVLDLMPGSAHFPLPTFVEPKPNGDGTWTATSADFERYFTKTGTPLKIQLTPESVKRLQTCPEWRGRQSTPSTTN